MNQIIILAKILRFTVSNGINDLKKCAFGIFELDD